MLDIDCAISDMRQSVGSSTCPRILLTGGGGVLGREILQALLAHCPGSGIVLASREKSLPGHLIAAGVTPIQLDIPRQIEIPRQIDIVIHAAGEKRIESLMSSVNDLGACKLATVAADAGVRRFVHISSVGVFGAPHGSGVLDEDAPCFPSNAYERSKLEGERKVKVVAETSGMELIILRPSTVLSYVPRSAYPLLSLMRAIQYGRFCWFGNGPYWTNYISVHDVARGVVAALDGVLKSGTYILNTPVPLDSLVGTLASALHVKVPRWRLPLWVGPPVVATARLAARLSGRSPVFDSARLAELTNTTVYDAARYLALAGSANLEGVSPYIERLVASYRAEGVIR